MIRMMPLCAVAGLLLCLALLSACATPVGVNVVSPQEAKQYSAYF